MPAGGPDGLANGGVRTPSPQSHLGGRDHLPGGADRRGVLNRAERAGFVNGVLATLAAWIRPDEVARPDPDPSGRRVSRRRAEQAHLVTADGEVFGGWSVGASGITVGEVVFNTAMSGYQEVFTDPSYAGQIVVDDRPATSATTGLPLLTHRPGGPPRRAW